MIPEPHSPARKSGSGWGGVFALAASSTLLRIVYLLWFCPYSLVEDEAHYWEWSRRLDLSYYSKGPLVAYLIAGLTGVFGTSAFGIRLGAVILSLVGAWALYRLGRAAFGRPGPGALAVVGLQVHPAEDRDGDLPLAITLLQPGRREVR